MRKCAKNECLELIDQIKEDSAALNKKNEQDRQAILEKIQEDAIVLGGRIEEQEGEENPAVEQLEQLCELVYEIYSGFKEDRGRVYQKASQIEKSILKVIKEEPEILFMPISSDDWSVMDTIWRAASAQDGCHVAVVPVPVWMIDDKAELPKYCTQVENYPPDVPLVDYREYDLGKCRPDVLFISGLAEDAGEEAQGLIRVAESFTAERLTAFTEKLVYVPGNIVPGQEGHILKSLDVAVFWRIYQPFGAKGQKNRIVSGSPVIDWLYKPETNESYQTHKKGFEDKKVFLLETGLQEVLQTPEQFLQSLEDAAGIFENRRDAALLWGPHLLTSHAIKRAGNMAEERYKALVKRIEAMPWAGVLHETRPAASVLSDAYIGGMENNLVLSVLQGHPAYLKNELRDKGRPFGLGTPAAAVWNGRLYISAEDFNGLFCLDPLTGKTEYLGEFSTERHRARVLHGAAVAYKDSIYFLPAAGDVITKVRPAAMEMEALPLPQLPRESSSYKFNRAVIQGTRLWALPGDSGAILELDMETGRTKVYDNWPRKIDFSCIPFRGGAVAGGRLWLCPYNSQALVYMDLQSGVMKAIPWDLPEQSFSDVEVQGNILWFCPQKGDAVLKVDAYTTECSYIEDFPDSFWPAADRYSSICFQDGAMWFAPFNTKAVLRIDLETERKRELGRTMEGKTPWKSRRSGCFSGIVRGEGNIYMLSTDARQILSIDTRTEQTECLSLEIPKELFIHRMSDCRKLEIASGHGEARDYVHIESQITPEQFVDGVCSGEIVTESAANDWFRKQLYQPDGGSGRWIWEDVWKHIGT